MPLSGHVVGSGAEVEGLVGLTVTAEVAEVAADRALWDEPQPAISAVAKTAEPVRATVLRPRRKR